MSCQACNDTGFSHTPTEFFCEVCGGPENHAGNPVVQQVRSLRAGIEHYTDPENIATTAEMANIFERIVNALKTIEDNL